MKRRDLIRIIESFGYKLLRHGSNHDVYSNGINNESIPKHGEIKEILAKYIIKRCGGK